MSKEGSEEFKTHEDGEVRVKKEKDEDDWPAKHSHSFHVKFSISDQREYTIYCNRPCTVLDAVESKIKYSKLTGPDENLIIQLGKGDKEFAVATHFPCSCVKDGECLIISYESEKVEEAAGNISETILPRHRYSVFHIDREGGVHTKTKELFRNSAVKMYKYLCVYGEKGMTVEDALKRDGRFVDDLGDFTLTDNDNPNAITDHADLVDNLDKKKFKLCLPRKKRGEKKRRSSYQGSPRASKRAQFKTDAGPSLDGAQQRRVRVVTAEPQIRGDNTAEVYKLLQEQCPALKKHMESRFPGNSLQEQVKLSQQNFGKIQASFSEVHRVEKLLQHGKSVCKVVVGSGICQGTGFVLFDNIILTNAHLFTLCGYQRDLWMEELVGDVTAVFYCEDPCEPEKWQSFKAVRILDLTHDDLDYAILELDLKDTSQNKSKPPGLLNRFAPMPENGEACIIGHPNGGVKKMDPTSIVGKPGREQNVKDQLYPFIAHTIINRLQELKIEDYLIGGKKADKRATYNTFMYQGSSGSPVFDGSCQVFGLHTGGFDYKCLNNTKSVLEYAQPALTIIHNFVCKLKKGHEDLFKRIKEEAKGNRHLRTICGEAEVRRGEIKVEPVDPGECSDDAELMQIA